MNRVAGWIGRWYEDHPTRLLLVIIFVLLSMGMAGYLVAAYGTVRLDQRWRGKLVEAMNYASQTVTTVGYGNIIPGIGSLRDSEQRIRLFSSFYSLVGPFTLGLLIQRLFGRASFN